MRYTLLTAASALALAAATAAPAAIVDPLGILEDFGTIALNDLYARSETEVNVYVGGDLISQGYTVNGDGHANGTVGDLSGSLIVGGTVSGADVNVQNGDVVLGETPTATVNLNGTGASLTTDAVPSADVTAAFESLSADLAAMDDTAGATVNNADQNLRGIASGAGEDGFAVVTMDDASFFSGGNLANFTRDEGVTLIVNVPGQLIDININNNWDDSSTIFNFFEATTINVNRTFGFGILATGATVNLNAGGTDTFVLGYDINQGTEVRGSFAGDLPDFSDGTDGSSDGAGGPAAVPLPASALLMLAALGGLAAARRKS